MHEEVAKEFIELFETLRRTPKDSEDYARVLNNIAYFDSMADNIGKIAEIRDAALSGELQALFSNPEIKLVEFPNEGSPFPDEPSPVGEARNVQNDVVHALADAQEKATEETAQKSYTLADVRAALAKAKSKGLVLSELFARYGATNIKDLPEDKYAEIIAAASAPN